MIEIRKSLVISVAMILIGHYGNCSNSSKTQKIGSKQSEKTIKKSGHQISGISGVFIYKSDDIYNFEDAIVRDDPFKTSDIHQSKHVYEVLQFYEDGLVIGISTPVKDIVKSWPKIKKWFNHEYRYNYGKYGLNGNRITFSLKSSYGTLDYSGIYDEDKMILSKFSHINGRKWENREYICYKNLK